MGEGRRFLDRDLALLPLPIATISAMVARSSTADIEFTDFHHHEADGAGLHVLAVPARLIGRAACTGERCQRAVDGADHMTDFDLARRAGEFVAAAGALPAVDDAGVAKFAENGVEKFFRNVVRFGDVDRLHRCPWRKHGEVRKGL